jgi:uncharacterized protein (DUF2252 family)
LKIQGDLHAENFGSYLNNQGILNFDVNDFDEGYCGPFTWDVKRLLASLNIVAHSKGFSDREIEEILRVCAEAYLKQVYEFCKRPDEKFSLTLKNTTGKVKKLLNETRIKSHAAHLDKMTVIKDYDRKFIRSEKIKDVDETLREQIFMVTNFSSKVFKEHFLFFKAFQNYLKSIPQNKKGENKDQSYNIKDVVARSSPGIGSAGKVSYSILLEGPTETLENDVILYMKPAQKSAISYVVQNPELEQYFRHDGLRTVLCSYAMQASTPKWLGYTSLGSIPCLVDEVTTFSEDLGWGDIHDFNEIVEVVTFLGRATGEILVLLKKKYFFFF